jgi:hypothetical protein
MKRIIQINPFLCLFIPLFFISCNIKNKELKENSKNEIPSTINSSKTKLLSDTIHELSVIKQTKTIDTLNYVSSFDDKKAFDIFDFKMKENEVNELIETHYPNKNINTGKSDFLMKFEYNENSELYQILLSCKYFIYDRRWYNIEFEALTELHDIIRQKYIIPTYISNECFPSISKDSLFETEVAELRKIAIWNIGKKEIVLGIKRWERSNYEVICRITNLEMEKLFIQFKKNQEENRKMQETKKEEERIYRNRQKTIDKF